MPRALTPKQEAFAQKYVETGSAAESYKFAYPTSQKWPLTTLYPEASKLLANPKVSTRIQALEERSLRRIDVSATDIARVAWQIATDEDKSDSARVSALALLAKRHPEFSDKHDVSINERSETLSVIASMSSDELRAYLDSRRTVSDTPYQLSGPSDNDVK